MYTLFAFKTGYLKKTHNTLVLAFCYVIIFFLPEIGKNMWFNRLNQFLCKIVERMV